MDNATVKAINDLRKDLTNRFENLEKEFKAHDVKKDFYYHIKAHKIKRQALGTIFTTIGSLLYWVGTKLPAKFYRQFGQLF